MRSRRHRRRSGCPPGSGCSRAGRSSPGRRGRASRSSGRARRRCRRPGGCRRRPSRG
ncbi:hypothetical protein ACFPRL_08895 [Pseudoclavibacter helvolus]